MKKLKERIANLGLSIKKELTTALAFSLVLLALGIVAFYMLNSYIYLGVGLVFVILFNLFYFSRYSKLEKEQNDLAKQDFVSLFTFFKIYLHNGYSVYTALKEIQAFADKQLALYLSDLIRDIDQDKTINPFIRFGRKFNDLIIEEMMISIYQMIDDGSNPSHLSQFDLIFGKISDLAYEKEINKKRNSLASMSTFPLVGSSILIVMVTFGIITVMEEMVNVL